MQNPEVFQFQDDFSDPKHCTACAGNAVKRRSPSLSSVLDPAATTISDSEPKPKKIMVQDDHLHRHGFNNVDLPISFPINSYPSLRRCVSDPYHSPGTTNNNNSPPNQIIPNDSGTFFNPQSPEKSALKAGNGNAPSPGRPTLPPPAPMLCRTDSDLINPASPPAPMLRRTVSDLTNPASPPAPMLVRNNSGSSITGDVAFGLAVPVNISKEESPNLKKVKRMKERMKEMHQLWEEVMREGEDDASQDNNNNNPRMIMVKLMKK